MLGQQHEDFQNGKGRALEHIRVGDFEEAVAHLKARIDWLRRLIVAVAQDHFFEVLHDQVIQFGHRHHGAVVLLHQALDGQLAVVVAETQQSGDFLLVVKQQAVFAAPGQHVQGITHLPEKILGGSQQAEFTFYQETLRRQRMQVERAELAAGDPENGLDVAQAAGGALDVGFEVVFGVVVLGVARVLLVAFGQKEVLARPHLLRAGDLQHALAQVLGAGNGAAFHQVGDDGQVGTGFVGALGDRAYALADFQADVPQQHEETFDRVAKQLLILVFQQDQQVDIRVRVQFAAAIAADSHQADGRLVAPGEAIPGFAQDLVDAPGTVFDQAANVAITHETCVEHVIDLPQGFLEGGNRAGLARQLRLELAAVKQLGINLRHITAFLIKK